MNVVCICGGFGFPVGVASSKRILLIGRGLVEEGADFEVLHIGPSAIPENTERSGEVGGVRFKYLSPSVRASKYWWVRVLCYLWGAIALPAALWRRAPSVVYIYYQGGLMNLWALCCSRILGIIAVQEACEWWPDTPKKSSINSFLYRYVMFRLSSGALVISPGIAERIHKVSTRNYSQIRIPVLVDPFEEQCPRGPEIDLSCKSRFTLLWCGAVHAYLDDVRFLIDALYRVTSCYKVDAVLRVCGPCDELLKEKLTEYASQRCIDVGHIHFTGFVSDCFLWQYCVNADALVMPLWNDDRSVTRFPTKMGLYVAAGSPIVTAAVGAIPDYLDHEETALFYEPGDSDSLAKSIYRLANERELGKKLSENASRTVLSRLDYRTHGKRLKDWLSSLERGK